MLNELAQHPGAGEVFLRSWRDAWKDIGAGKIKWKRLLSFDGLHNRIGLNALCGDAGYRNDGSYQYGTHDLEITNPQHPDYHFAKTLKLIAAGVGRFPWGDTPSAPALKEIDALLDFCAAHQIHVIAFMPPHAHAVWTAMEELGDRYAYIPKLEHELRSRFEGRGFEFYDFSDFIMFGAPDSEAVDGYHGNERANLRLFITMLERGSRLNAYANLPELRATLAAAESPRELLPPAP